MKYVYTGNKDPWDSTGAFLYPGDDGVQVRVNKGEVCDLSPEMYRVVSARFILEPVQEPKPATTEPRKGGE